MSWKTNRETDKAREEEIIRREFEFMKKYGVDISNIPFGMTAMLEGVCHSAYNRGWADCRAKVDGKDTNVPSKWIPCSEDNMPEELVPVNVTWVNRKPPSYYKDIKDKPFTATAIYYKKQWFWWSPTIEDRLSEYGLNGSAGLSERLHPAIEIAAWMPLPEPYEKEVADRVGGGRA